MTVQTNINNRGSNLETELDKQVASSMAAEDVINHIDNLLMAAPEIFESDKCHAFGKVYSGDIQIAVRSIVGGDESVTEFYAIEDGGIVFAAERHKNDPNIISSVFIASGYNGRKGLWAEKLEELESRVRATH